MCDRVYIYKYMEESVGMFARVCLWAYLHMLLWACLRMCAPNCVCAYAWHVLDFSVGKCAYLRQINSAMFLCVCTSVYAFKMCWVLQVSVQVFPHMSVHARLCMIVYKHVYA